MLFLLNTPEYTNVQSNTTKVKVHLKNGVAEILDQHQDLMGRVENNIVEIETNFENKTEKNLFVLQDAVFIVSTKGLDKKLDKKTSVYVYAKNVKEINSRLAIDEITKQYEKKLSLLETETLKLSAQNSEKLENSIKSKIFMLNEDTEFLKKVLTLAKQPK
jgi:F0F1-type ATP synthase epsilon subunit